MRQSSEMRVKCRCSPFATKSSPSTRHGCSMPWTGLISVRSRRSSPVCSLSYPLSSSSSSPFPVSSSLLRVTPTDSHQVPQSAPHACSHPSTTSSPQTLPLPRMTSLSSNVRGLVRSVRLFFLSLLCYTHFHSQSCTVFFRRFRYICTALGPLFLVLRLPSFIRLSFFTPSYLIFRSLVFHPLHPCLSSFASLPSILRTPSVSSPLRSDIARR